MSVDTKMTKRARLMAARAICDFNVTEGRRLLKALADEVDRLRELLLKALADEVDRLRELLRGVHRCDSHDDVSNAWGCPECVRELRDEVDRLQRKDRRDMDDDLAWALKGKHALMERENEVWEPLLAAAKEAERWMGYHLGAIEDSEGDIKKRLQGTIAACEEKP